MAYTWGALIDIKIDTNIYFGYSGKREMLLTSGTPVYAVVQACHSYVTGQGCLNKHLIQFQVGSPSTTPMWTKVFSSINQQALWLEFSEIESVFYALVYSDPSTVAPSGSISIVRIYRTDGSIHWAKGHSQISALFGAVKIYQYSSAQTVVISVDGYNFFNFMRLIVTGGVVTGSQHRQLNLPILQASVIKDAMQKGIYKLFVTLHSSVTQLSYITEIDFSTNSATLKNVFGKISSPVNQGTFITEAHYLQASYQVKIQMDAQNLNSFIQQTYHYQGVIYSSDQTQSCTILSNDPQQTVTLLTQGLPVDLTSQKYYSTTDLTFTITTQTGITTQDLILSRMSNQDNFCSKNAWQYTEAHQYSTLTQQTIAITEMDISNFCTAPTTIITYSLTAVFNNPLPAWISLDPVAKTITTTISAPLGINYFVLTGTYNPENVKVYALLQFEGVANTNTLPPVFDSPLVDQTVFVYMTHTYTLPTYTDPDGSTSISWTCTGPSGSSLPSFVQWGNPITQPILVFNPNLDLHIGNYTLEVTLTDSQFQSVYSFALEVKDIIPPSFEGGARLIDQYLHVNSVIQYNVPSYSDQQNLLVTLTYTPSNLEFLQFESGAFTIAPIDNSVVGDTIVTITLSNGYRSNSYSFIVTVVNFPPYFMSGLLPIDIKLPLNLQMDHRLPLFIDSEMDIVSVGHYKIPKFMKWDVQRGAYDLYPTLPKDIGTHLVEGYLTDGLGQTGFNFKVTVTNAAPFIKDDLQDQFVNLNDDLPYKLPVIFDQEFLPSRAVPSLMGGLPLPSFIKFSSSDNTFKFKPVKSQQVGMHKIMVAVTDDYATPSFYFFYLTVMDIQKSAYKNADYKQSIIEKKKEDKDFNIYNANVKITQAGRDQRIRIQIVTLNHAQDIVNLISEDDLEVRLESNDQIIPITIQQRDPNSGIFKLLLEFENPQEISRQSTPDVIKITVNREVFHSTETYLVSLRKDQIDRVAMPPQLSSKLSKLAETIRDITMYTAQTAVPLGLLLNAIVSMCIQYLWGFLNDLSFLTISSMISVRLPGIAQIIQAAFLNFIYLDILMTDKWLLKWIFPEQTPSQNPDSEDSGEDQPINPQFDENGFSSMILLKNLGSTFLYFILLVLGYAVLAVTYLFDNLKNFQNYLKSKLQWNAAIRFIIQQYPPMLIASIINLYNIKYDTYGEMLSSGLSIFIITSIPFIAILLWNIQRQYNGRMETFIYQDKYSNLVEGLNLKTISGMYWNVLVFGRWVITAATIVVLRDYPSLQIIVLLPTSIVFQCLILHGQPIEQASNNKVTFVNEAMVSIYMYLMMSLMDFNSLNPQRELFGHLIVGLIFLSVIINFIKFLVGVTKALIFKFCTKKAKITPPINQPIQQTISSHKLPTLEMDNTSTTSNLRIRTISNFTTGNITMMDQSYDVFYHQNKRPTELIEDSFAYNLSDNHHQQKEDRIISIAQRQLEQMHKLKERRMQTPIRQR